MAKQPVTEAHISDLAPDPENARRHNARNLGMIEDSLHAVGAGRSIVIDEDNVILAGNGTIEAAGQAGFEKVLIVPTDGETIVAVKRTGLTPEQKRRLALYDNRSSDLASWDPRQLARAAEAGIDLSEMFTPEEIEAVMTIAEADPGLDDIGLGSQDNDGNPVIHYDIIFENTAQQDAWFALVRFLRAAYPEAETIGERIRLYAEAIGINEDGSVGQG